MAKSTSGLRGIRNNNPGNIDYNAQDKWQGLANPPIESGVPKPRFAVFKSPTYGIRAIARLLITYYDKHNLDTVAKVLNRWAPTVENDTSAYAAAVARDLAAATGDPLFTVDTKIDLHNWQHLRALVCGIIEHENGLKHYTEAYADDVIDKALTLAGVEPRKKPLMQTKTIGGAIITGTATGVPLLADLAQKVSDNVPEAATVGIVANTVRDQLEPISDEGQWIHMAFLAAALVGVAIVVYARIRQRQKGIN